MKIVKPGVEVLTPLDGNEILRHIERCGRVCYKSEGKITDSSAERLIRNIIDRGHESVLEHYNITVRFVCDRGISHEIVRHRIASYSQESTRYCNYSNDKFGGEITVITPSEIEKGTDAYLLWATQCAQAETSYFAMLNAGCTPQTARSVLPHCLKTEVIMTSNIREWRHFLRLRCSPAAHPDIRELAFELLNIFKSKTTVLFDDIEGVD